ncbi:Imidazolonepropionase [subsurface metagenome]|nr:amidohydrolase family protein [bacterium]
MILFKDALIHSPPRKSLRADLLVEGSRIAKIGRVESSADAGTYENKVLLPGYIDSHIHLLEYGYSLIFLDLREVRSREEFFTSLSSYLSTARELGFLYAFNLAPERLKETDWEPLTSDLDKISKDVPILIRREDGHSVYLNKAARRWLLYDQPIEHANDHLTGRFNELAVERMQERIPREVRIEAFIKAGADLLAKGVTSAAVMIGDEASLGDVEVIGSVGERLGIEAALFPQNRDVGKICDLELTRLGGCILIDGSFGSHTAALREPYTDAPGNNGILYFSQRELNALVKCTEEAGLQMTFHAIGDEAIEQLLTAYEKTIDPANSRRHRIEHAELMPPDLIERAAKLNLILGVQPMFEIAWGQKEGMYAERLGERRRWTNPYRSILDAGIRIAAGSDAPITLPDPAEGITAFLNHPIAEERITVEEAVAAYTSEGAYAVHLEERIGSLREGLDADILVFDRDPFVSNDFHPIAVIKSGKLVAGSL